MVAKVMLGARFIPKFMMIVTSVKETVYEAEGRIILLGVLVQVPPEKTYDKM